GLLHHRPQACRKPGRLRQGDGALLADGGDLHRAGDPDAVLRLHLRLNPRAPLPGGPGRAVESLRGDPLRALPPRGPLSLPTRRAGGAGGLRARYVAPDDDHRRHLHHLRDPRRGAFRGGAHRLRRRAPGPL
ncbi:MAG: Succinate dehydrogenase hydrophobic membrane anchor protein, partial [uncultured Rubellimicrobium sp.]